MYRHCRICIVFYTKMSLGLTFYSYDGKYIYKHRGIDGTLLNKVEFKVDGANVNNVLFTENSTHMICVTHGNVLCAVNPDTGLIVATGLFKDATVSNMCVDNLNRKILIAVEAINFLRVFVIDLDRFILYGNVNTDIGLKIIPQNSLIKESVKAMTFAVPEDETERVKNNELIYIMVMTERKVILASFSINGKYNNSRTIHESALNETFSAPFNLMLSNHSDGLFCLASHSKENVMIVYDYALNRGVTKKFYGDRWNKIISCTTGPEYRNFAFIQEKSNNDSEYFDFWVSDCDRDLEWNDFPLETMPETDPGENILSADPGYGPGTNEGRRRYGRIATAFHRPYFHVMILFPFNEEESQEAFHVAAFGTGDFYRGNYATGIFSREKDSQRTIVVGARFLYIFPENEGLYGVTSEGEIITKDESRYHLKNLTFIIKKTQDSNDEKILRKMQSWFVSESSKDREIRKTPIKIEETYALMIGDIYFENPQEKYTLALIARGKILNVGKGPVFEYSIKKDTTIEHVSKATFFTVSDNKQGIRAFNCSTAKEAEAWVECIRAVQYSLKKNGYVEKTREEFIDEYRQSIIDLFQTIKYHRGALGLMVSKNVMKTIVDYASPQQKQ